MSNIRCEFIIMQFHITGRGATEQWTADVDFHTFITLLKVIFDN